jgi:hypothetical protein
VERFRPSQRWCRWCQLASGAASCFLVKASGFWSSGLPALFYGDVEEEDDGRWVIFSKNVKVCGCGAKVCHVLNSQHSKKYNKKKEYSPPHVSVVGYFGWKACLFCFNFYTEVGVLNIDCVDGGQLGRLN